MPNTLAHPDRPALSEAGHEVIERRAMHETRVRGLRELLRFSETSTSSDKARDVAFYRSQLTEAVNALAQFDMTELTDECKARLAFHGVEFTAAPALVEAAA